MSNKVTTKKLDAAFANKFAISLSAFGKVIGFQRESLVPHVEAGTLRVISKGKHLYVTRAMADAFLATGGLTGPTGWETKEAGSVRPTRNRD